MKKEMFALAIVFLFVFVILINFASAEGIIPVKENENFLNGLANVFSFKFLGIGSLETSEDTFETPENFVFTPETPTEDNEEEEGNEGSDAGSENPVIPRCCLYSRRCGKLIEYVLKPCECNFCDCISTKGLGCCDGNGNCEYDSCKCQAIQEGKSPDYYTATTCNNEKNPALVFSDFTNPDNIVLDPIIDKGITGFAIASADSNTWTFKVKKGEKLKFSFTKKNDANYHFKVGIRASGDLISGEQGFSLDENTFISQSGSLLSGDTLKADVSISTLDSENTMSGKIIIEYSYDPLLSIHISGKLVALRLQLLSERDPAKRVQIQNEINKWEAEKAKLPPVGFIGREEINIVIVLVDENGCVVNTVTRSPGQKEVKASLVLKGSDTDSYVELVPEYDKNRIESIVFSEKNPIKIPKNSEKKISYTVKFKEKSWINDIISGLLTKDKCEKNSDEIKKQQEEDKKPTDIKINIKNKKGIFSCIKTTIKTGGCCIKKGSKEEELCIKLFGKDNFEPCGEENAIGGIQCCYKSDPKNPLSGGCHSAKPKVGGTQYLCCMPGEEKKTFKSLVGDVPVCSPVEESCRKIGKTLCRTKNPDHVFYCCPVLSGGGDICMNYETNGVQTPSCGRLKCNPGETKCPAGSNPFTTNDPRYPNDKAILCCDNQYEECVESPYPALPIIGPIYPLPVCIAKDVPRQGYFRCKGTGEFAWSARWCTDDEECIRHPSNGVPVCIPKLKK